MNNINNININGNMNNMKNKNKKYIHSPLHDQFICIEREEIEN